MAHDCPVRRRATCATLNGMKPHQFTISAEREEFHKFRRPAMRNACDAFICSVLGYLADPLTVFSGAGVARKLLPADLPSKSFAWERVVAIMA